MIMKNDIAGSYSIQYQQKYKVQGSLNSIHGDCNRYKIQNITNTNENGVNKQSRMFQLFTNPKKKYSYINTKYHKYK